jgi:uncharacterized protein (TIGR02147 family)
MRDFFTYNHYRDILHDHFADDSKSWGAVTRWSEAIACQRSHLSRVMSGQKDLSAEQALATCEFLKLTEAETEFFLLLVERERAGTKAYRDRILAKVRKIKAEREDLARRINQDRIGVQEQELLYYSAWYWSALHIAVNIPELQTVESLSQKFQLPPALVESCLNKLEEFGLIAKDRNRWKFASASVYLPKTSPLAALHHQSWRQRAVLDAQTTLTQNLHFTMVQSISRADFDKIKARLLSVIDEYAATAGPSEPEMLISFVCDFYEA